MLPLKISDASFKLTQRLIHDIVRTLNLVYELKDSVTDGVFRLGEQNIFFTAEELTNIYKTYKAEHINCNCYPQRSSMTLEISE